MGGVSLDVILPDITSLPKWPDHSEFTSRNLVLTTTPPILTLGGNGGNAAFVAARCGAEVTLHTSLGEDAHGSLVRGWLEEAGCRVLTTAPGPTPLNLTAANAKHQRATFFYPGTTIQVPKRDLEKGGYLLICGWPHPPLGDIAPVLARAQARGTFTSLDAGPILGRPWSREYLRSLLEHLDLFIANAHEFNVLMRSNDLPKSIGRLRDVFDGNAVIKRGGEGALWLPAGKSEAVPIAAPSIRAVNTVGAGDSFNGALLAALAIGMPLPRAMKTACRVASDVVRSARGVVGLPVQKLVRKKAK